MNRISKSKPKIIFKVKTIKKPTNDNAQDYNYVNESLLLDSDYPSQLIEANPPVLSRKRERFEKNEEDDIKQSNHQIVNLYYSDVKGNNATRNSFSDVSSKTISENLTKYEGNSSMNENKQSDEKSTITVNNIKPGREFNKVEIFKQSSISTKDINNNIFPVLNDISDSSFLYKLDDYKSSSNISDTTVKNNINFDCSVNKELSFGEKEEDMKINYDTNNERDNLSILLEANNSENFSKKRDLMEKISMDEHLSINFLKKINKCESENIKENSDNSSNKINEESENKENSFDVRISINDTLNNVPNESIDNDRCISFAPNNDFVFLTEFNDNDFFIEIFLYFSISCTIVVLIKYISPYQDFFEIFNLLNQKSIFIIFLCLSLIVYYFTHLQFILISNNIQTLIYKNLELNRMNSNYYLKETQVIERFSHHLDLQSKLLIIQRIIQRLKCNPKIETFNLDQGEDTVTCWRWVE